MREVTADRSRVRVRRSRLLRAFGLAFAILQLTLQGAFTVTDGYAEGADASVSALAPHSIAVDHHRFHDTDCAICHLIAGGSEIPPRGAGIPEPVHELRSAPCTEFGSRPFSVTAGADRARAPPVVV